MDLSSMFKDRPIKPQVSDYPPIKPGQVWKFPGQSPDPFLREGALSVQILAVREGHVKFGFSNGNTGSLEAKVFQQISILEKDM